jgi:hypothetical protein
MPAARLSRLAALAAGLALALAGALVPAGAASAASAGTPPAKAASAGKGARAASAAEPTPADSTALDNWNAWGPGGSTPDPDPVTGGKIVNGATSKCVDRAGGSTVNGTAVQ